MKRVLAVFIIFTMTVFVLAACGSSGSSSDKAGEEIDWPDTEIGCMLPDTDAKARSSSISDSYISAELNMNKEEYKDYLEKCKEKGFTENVSSTDNETYRNYTADNKNGYSLSLSWYSGDNRCQLLLSAPADRKTEEDNEDGDEEDDKKEEKKSKKKKSSDDESSSSDGVTPSFKKAMDQYEKFFDKYVEFLDDYSNGKGDLTEYAEIMAEYSETMSKLEEIDEESLSDADAAYYLEVMTRINTKLAEAAQ